MGLDIGNISICEPIVLHFYILCLIYKGKVFFQIILPLAPKKIFMKKQVLILISILFLSHKSQAQDSAFTINGQLEKIKDGTIFLNIYEGSKTVNDSALITNGSFKFTGSVTSPFFATLTMPVKRNDYYTFYIEPAAMSISGRGDSLKLLTVKGSKLNDDNRLFKERMKYVTKWEETNSTIYEEAYTEKNKRVMDSLDEVDNNILNEKRKVVSAFVKDYPQSMRGAMAITENYGYYAEASDVKPLYDLLDQQIKNSTKGIEIKKLIDVYSTVAIGKTAPEIAQSTTDGKTLSLSSLHGKYVLLDFWAS